MKFSPLTYSALLTLCASASSFAPKPAGGFLRRSLATTGGSSGSTSSLAADGGDDDMYDLVVIGAGSGGVRASRISSGYGKKVAIIEGQLNHGPPNYSAVGGTCVNVGCVPKKLMVFASRYPSEIREAAGYGWQGASEGTFDWKKFMEYKDAEISRLNNVYQKFVLAPAGVEIIEGYGSLNGKNAVDVKLADGSTKTLNTKNVLVAVGGWPFKPSIPGIEHSITSNEIFYLEEQPKRMVVIGGGFIALEFAQIMDGLGTDVTLMYRGDLFLRGFDMDMREHLRDEMVRNTDIDVQFNTNPKEIRKNADGSLTVVTDDGKEVECDQVLSATGRKGKLDNLNLESAGVTSNENNFIPVDEYSRTNVDGVYAVGDITDRIALTPVALMEGHRLADTLFGGQDRPVDHEFVASTVFTNPEIGTVGYTEDEAVAKFKNVDVYTTRFRPMKHSFPKSEAYSFFKIIVDADTDKVVGVHVATDGAGEMIQGVAIAVKMGATKADFDNTIGIHPTSAEELVTMRSPSYTFRNGAKVEEEL
jgi:glutathione reductase (NADPH)